MSKIYNLLLMTRIITWHFYYVSLRLTQHILGWKIMEPTSTACIGIEHPTLALLASRSDHAPEQTDTATLALKKHMEDC